MFPDYRAVRVIQARRYPMVNQDPGIDTDPGIDRWERRLRELASRISPDRVASRLKLRENGQA